VPEAGAGAGVCPSTTTPLKIQKNRQVMKIHFFMIEILLFLPGRFVYKFPTGDGISEEDTLGEMGFQNKVDIIAGVPGNQSCFLN
jgi:hypothetical protein